ncbi:MAG: glycosyltransferase [Desulfobulbaceae bacterium]|nr:glycosyltransferase [Desulfobulbaceae bacterium]
MVNRNRISIIIPSYNKGIFIEETILSVLDQSYKDIELIVIDGGSTDDTHSILRKYRQGISQCVIEPDNGQSGAINKGIRLATGEFAGWLNADDLLYSGAIQAVADGFASHPGVGVVYGRGTKIDIQGADIKDIPFRPFNAHLLRQLFYILQPSMYFRREKFFQVGGLEERNHFAMDWELVLKLLDVTEFVAIPDKIGKLRMYKGTKTADGGWDAYKELAGIGKKYNGILDINYLAFHARTIVSKIDVPVVKTILRKCVDYGCSLMARGELYMVCQWPEYFQNLEDPTL